MLELTDKIAAQAALIPAMYGHVDFSLVPERFAAAPGDETDLDPKFAARRPELLADRGRVALIKAYTMMGDTVADAYAARMPDYGFRRLVGMLDEACDHGVERVANAPQELVRFIRQMERLPDWLDMKLIEDGARAERNGYAHRAPYVIRGGLLATFMNKYSALPMAMTGVLSSSTAARRTMETATFFTTTVMPGALTRYGAGFKAAAKVRLMHSMVRFNALRHDRWDVKTYGTPIPQVDQMPAGLISIFLLSQKVLREGRTAFASAERARCELARYRCFLLGLPEELLADSPQGIVDMFLTRHATLRKGFDENCRALVGATMAADLTSGPSLAGRVHAWLEHGFAKVYFVTNFMRGNKRAAANVGVKLGVSDYLAALAAGLFITTRMTIYTLAARIPLVRQAADRSLERKLSRQLARYGHAEFTTNANSYRSAHT
jgi:small basic protein